MSALSIVLLALAMIVPEMGLLVFAAMVVTELRAIRRLLAGQAAHERVIDDGGI